MGMGKSKRKSPSSSASATMAQQQQQQQQHRHQPSSPPPPLLHRRPLHGPSRMASVVSRYISFNLFPEPVTSQPLILSDLGFYYPGRDTIIRCYYCGVEHDVLEWQGVESQTVIKTHRRKSPNCSNLPNGETKPQTPPPTLLLPVIPPSAGANSSTTTTTTEYPHLTTTTVTTSRVPYFEPVGDWKDIRFTPLFTPERRQLAEADQRQQQQQSLPLTPPSSPSPSSTIPPSLQRHRHPHDRNRIKYPDYKSEEVRRKSFDDGVEWDKNLFPPSEMAKAGFYYVGYGDHVRCFHCGIGLTKWVRNDIPWVEHAKWSASCMFLEKEKGVGFVRNVTMQFRGGLTKTSIATLQEMGYSLDDIQTATDCFQRVHGGGQTPTLEDIVDIISDFCPRTGGALVLENDFRLNRISDHPFYGDELPPGCATADDNGEEYFRYNSENGKIEYEPPKQKEEDSHPASHNEFYLCKICLTEQVCITFNPCGHICCCQDCSKELTLCPMCRRRIKQKIRSYF